MILAAAERATRVGTVPSLVQLLADASVRGPSGEFRTRIYSSSDGRVRMEQPVSGFVAGVGGSGGWRLDPSNGIDTMGPMLGFVRGHELHMLAVMPRSRLERPRYLGTREVDGRSTLAVAMSRPNGDSLVAYFDPVDSLPVGFVITWADPHVEVSVADWVEHPPLLLFRAATFRQGSEEFRYTYDSLRVGPIPDSVFEPLPVAGGTPDA